MLNSASSSPTFLNFCPLCNKPFTREYSYNRHVLYCRRTRTKSKTRARSCQGCSTAKTKCSFEQPSCARCSAKGAVCVYVRPGRAAAASQLSVIDSVSAEPLAQIDFGQVPSPTDSITALSPIPIYGPDFGDLDDIQILPLSDLSFPDFDVLGSQEMQLASPVSQTNRTTNSNPVQTLTLFKRLHPANPVIRHAANSAMNIIRSFPQMMIRRHTFPPFIHPLWHLPTLPDALATCMSISQLFVARTSETRPFLWRSIRCEEERARKTVDVVSEKDLHYTIQAMQMYMIMIIVEQDEGTLERGAHMLLTCQILCLKFQSLVGGRMCEPERNSPSETWEDWIFAESRRRMTCLCFLVSNCVSGKAGILCLGFHGYEDLPLCSAKTMWEARTREEWESERAFHELGTLHHEMWKFGRLVEAHRCPEDPVNAERLDAWDAGTDKMGTLMNLAVSFTDLGR